MPSKNHKKAPKVVLPSKNKLKKMALDEELQGLSDRLLDPVMHYCGKYLEFLTKKTHTNRPLYWKVI